MLDLGRLQRLAEAAQEGWCHNDALDFRDEITPSVLLALVERVREAETACADLVRIADETTNTVPRHDGPPDGPGHCHLVHAVWDADGEPCEWCHAWDRVRVLGSRSTTEKENE